MKRKLIIGLGVIAIALGSAMVSKTNQTTDSLSATQIENLEALSSGEGGYLGTGPYHNGCCLCINYYPCRDTYECH